ncbi:Alpha/Beta hydrolase fold [Trichophyton rubrum]|nr:Alpha/Beta hydrolase fold [Trichophyton rubrum]
MLVPPVVLIGLTVTLWLYKCTMMVIFQNKIIYMPSIPPFSRQEKIATYEKVCWPIVWEEQRIQSLDGVEIALCVGRNVAMTGEKEEKKVKGPEGEVVILYFQGNGSSIPPRLPQLSAVLKALDERPYILIAVSYRGFWTSRGRASQRGIERDAVAALNWARKTYLHPNTRLVLWGQSIGAGVATFLAASHHRQHDCLRRSEPPALILETPFVSVRSMLLALYPQRWLPYRYLGPFLRNWWDSEEALRSISDTRPNGTGRRKVLVVSAEKDELVPSEQADAIEKLCIEGGMDVSRTRVRGALHTEATFRGDGRNAVASFLKRL